MEKVVDLTSRRFTLEEEPRDNLNGRLIGLHSLSGRLGEVRNICDVPSFEPWIFQLVAYSLYRLCYAGPYVALLRYSLRYVFTDLRWTCAQKRM